MNRSQDETEMGHIENYGANQGYRMWKVTNGWQRMLKHELQKVNLTHVQFVLLISCSKLMEAGSVHGVTQTQISQHAATDPMMTSEVLRTLEKKGYINRLPHPHDTRAKLISMTEEGLMVIEEAEKIVHEAETRFFSRLGSEQTEFFRLLSKLETN